MTALKETDRDFNQRIALDLMHYWQQRGCSIEVSIEAITGLTYAQRDGAAYAVRSDMVDGLPRSDR